MFLPVQHSLLPGAVNSNVLILAVQAYFYRSRLARSLTWCPIKHSHESIVAGSIGYLQYVAVVTVHLFFRPGGF